MTKLRRTGASGLLAILSITTLVAILPFAPVVLAQMRPPSLLPPGTPQPPNIGHRPRKYVEGELIVKYRPETTGDRRRASLRDHRGLAIRSLGDETMVHVKIPSGRSVADSLDEYNADPDVEFVQPNYLIHASGQHLPNTSDLGNLWAFRNSKQTIAASIALGSGGATIPQDQPHGWVYPIDNGTESTAYDMAMEDAWLVSTDCSNTIVAVVDTGVNYTMTNMATNMWNAPGSATTCQNSQAPIHGCDFVEGTNTPMDKNGHGTHVAGTIGAVGSAATLHSHTGVCWSAQIMAIRVLDATGSGTTANAILGIDYAINNGAKVLNMSFGEDGFDNAYTTEILKGKNLGALFVVAAGNATSDNDINPVSPCVFSQDSLNVICVAAVDQGGALASFSNFGGATVTVAAPGTNIISTYPGQVFPYEDNFSGQACNVTWGCGVAAGTTGAGWTINAGTSMTDVPEASETNDFTWTDYSLLDTNLSTSTLTPFPALNFASSGVITKMQLYGSQSLGPLDAFNVYLSTTPGDPDPLTADPSSTNTGTVVFQNFGNLDFSGVPFFSGNPQEADITSFIAGQTSVSMGFQMVSGAGSSGGGGVIITPLSMTQLVQDTGANNHYNILNGTSQATPHVAGLAAMLYSNNPNATYRTVYEAIVKGGTALSSLRGTTLTGMGINAFNSVIYVSPPSGVFGSVP